MKLKLTAVLLILVLALGLAACNSQSGPLTEEKAYDIVYKHAGLNADDAVDPHLHVIAENGVPMYNIHFSANGVDYDYNIHAKTGEILTHTP